MDTCLLEPGGHVRVEDDARIYSTSAGEDIATMRLAGDTLVVQFIAPQVTVDLDLARAFYQPVPGKPGWLEYRRPATRDPRPSLEARVGGIVGRASHERRGLKS
jgi:hypothetical protein